MSEDTPTPTPQPESLPLFPRLLMALATRQAAKSGAPSDWRIWLILLFSAYSTSGADISLLW